MYSLLSPLSQAAITPAEFQARYKTWPAAPRLTGIDAHVLSVLKSGLTAQALYEVTLHTAVVGSSRARSRCRWSTPTAAGRCRGATG